MDKRLNADLAAKQFWEDNRRFADLFNAVFFNGEKKIDPSKLRDRGTDVSASVPVKEHFEHVRKYLDVSKMYEDVELTILGIENQGRIHYAMPLRTRLYDDLDYLKECRSLAGLHRELRDLDGADEFLSGMKKGERLHLSLRIVVYYGEKPWDGSRRLSEMVDVPEAFLPFFQDYEMPLVCINEEENFKRPYREEGVRNLMGQLYLIYHRDWDTIREMDACLDHDTALVLAAVTGNKSLIQLAEKERGGLHMCNALAELEREKYEEGREEGRMMGHEEGREEGRAEGREEGREEVILNMLKANMEEKVVAQISGTTISRLRQIKEKHGL